MDDMGHIALFLSQRAEQALLGAPVLDRYSIGLEEWSGGSTLHGFDNRFAECGGSGHCRSMQTARRKVPERSLSSSVKRFRSCLSGERLAQGQFSVIVLRARSRRFLPHPRFLSPNNVYSRHIRISPGEIRKCQMKSGSKHLKTAEK